MSNSSFMPQNTIKPAKRKIKKVPFVELFNGRVQGVVSSGSDIRRVYVSFFEAETLNFYCSTNNNRRCGGLGPCNHLKALLEQAVAQYGVEQVARFLKVPGDWSQMKSARDIQFSVRGSIKKEPASEVFSRFLNYLRYFELDPSDQPISEMNWFI